MFGTMQMALRYLGMEACGLQQCINESLGKRRLWKLGGQGAHQSAFDILQSKPGLQLGSYCGGRVTPIRMAACSSSRCMCSRGQTR